MIRGGHVDLAIPKRTIVIMEHVNKAGEPKIKPACELPLTGRHVVDRLITDLAVFDFVGASRELVLVEMQPGVTLDEVRAQTDADFAVEAPTG